MLSICTLVCVIVAAVESEFNSYIDISYGQP